MNGKPSDPTRLGRTIFSMHPKEKSKDRLTKGIVPIADDHMGCIGDIAEFGMGHERPELIHSLERHKIARSTSD